MLILRATAKLRQRIDGSADHVGGQSTTVLGDWYASMLRWRLAAALGRPARERIADMPVTVAPYSQLFALGGKQIEAADAAEHQAAIRGSMRAAGRSRESGGTPERRWLQ